MTNIFYHIRILVANCIYPRKDKDMKDFNKLDINKDCKISMNEFQDYFFAKKGRPPTDEEWTRFHFADKQNDGFMTLSEFENYLVKDII